MDASPLALSALAALGVLSITLLLALFYRRLTISAAAGFWRGVLITGLSGFIVALATWPLTASPPLYIAPIAASGALFAVLATAPLRARLSLSGRLAAGWPTVLFAATSTALVFTPGVAFSFGAHTDQVGTGIGLIDFAGSLPALLAPGAVGLGAIVAQRLAGPKLSAFELVPSLPWRSVVGPDVLLVVAWLAWSIGVELAFDSYLSLIVGTVLLMAFGGLVGGSVIERVHRRENTPAGAALGLIAGLAASAPASASLTPTIAFVTALVIGGLCALLPRQGASSVLATLMVASGASLIALGALATNMSFIYTGQPEVLFTQAFAVLVVGGIGVVWGAAGWFVLARFTARQATPGR